MFLKEDFQDKLVVSKSVFITYLRRCKTEEAYKAFLSEIKKKHYDATHCCSAFVSKDCMRSSDDGEPSGTAGVPILNAIQAEQMEELAAIVVRYYGGVKLGASGLIRTYRQATSLAIKQARKIEEITYPVFHVQCDYPLENKLTHFLRKYVVDLQLDYQQAVDIYYASTDSYQDQLENIARCGLDIRQVGEKMIEKEIQDE